MPATAAKTERRTRKVSTGLWTLLAMLVSSMDQLCRHVHACTHQEM